MNIELVMAEVMRDFQMTGFADGIYGDFVREVAKRMVGWQPIETAPKDGTAIWAFEGGAQTSVRWCEYDCWELIVTGDGPLDSDEFSPTHWMPLLEAPNAELTGKAGLPDLSGRTTG